MKRIKINITRSETATRKNNGCAKKNRDPLRNNPVVGFMSEAQAERILEEMREEEQR